MLRLAPVLLATALAAAPALPQQPGTPADRAAQAAVIDLDFRGGTLAEFVAAVRGAQPRANIILAESVAAVRLPTVQLRGAGIEQALEAATLAAAGDKRVMVSTHRGNGTGGEFVFVVTAQPEPTSIGPAGQGRGGEKMLRVFSLARLTDQQPNDPPNTAVKATTILTAIESGMTGLMDVPTLRYHEDSGLLFVQGSGQQIAVVQEVLQSIESTQQYRRASNRGAGGPPVDVTPKDGRK